mmetsp:Transcript_24577/g.55923  ORF Transcript_24577/g.55923 Transcript_24577/m.55923 type:complete len:217 (+) Transcript_24577:2107-2757(+)
MSMLRSCNIFHSGFGPGGSSSANSAPGVLLPPGVDRPSGASCVPPPPGSSPGPGFRQFLPVPPKITVDDFTILTLCLAPSISLSRRLGGLSEWISGSQLLQRLETIDNLRSEEADSAFFFLPMRTSVGDLVIFPSTAGSAGALEELLGTGVSGFSWSKASSDSTEVWRVRFGELPDDLRWPKDRPSFNVFASVETVWPLVFIMTMNSSKLMAPSPS